MTIEPAILQVLRKLSSTIVEREQLDRVGDVKSYSHPPLQEVSLVSVMQALSDPCRLAIVRALLEPGITELACNEISLDISKATRSHHFTVLREAGVLFTRADATKCMSSVRKSEVEARFPGLLALVLGTKRGLTKTHLPEGKKNSTRKK